MITCFLRYEINPAQIDTFEKYSRLWISLVTRFGGVHHGYLMPSEGASDVAYASFSFPSMAAYEAYREKSFKDPDCIATFKIAEESGCIKRYERSFMRPVFEGLEP